MFIVVLKSCFNNGFRATDTPECYHHRFIHGKAGIHIRMHKRVTIHVLTQKRQAVPLDNKTSAGVFFLHMGIKENLDGVLEKMERAMEHSGGQEVRLIAVSKTYSAEIVTEAYGCGIRDFGENRVQELLPKMDACPKDINWRLIGHLQSNKINKIAGRIHALDSLDSLSTAEKLNRRLGELGAELEVLVEVNTSGDANKNGIIPEEVTAFTERLSALHRLKPAGLMTIGPLGGDEYANRKAFTLLRELRDSTAKVFPEYRELSMGMSGDFEEAIKEGATMVRVGSLIFGSRVY